jgi:site-specific DNA recombinase
MDTRKRVGIWIRVSTEMQVKDESPEHHEKRGQLAAEARDWEVVEVYRLEAVSGKSVMHHIETKRMLEDIKSGHITGLIFSKLARLARNTRELLEFAELFRLAGADLISLSENIDTSSAAGRLFYTMIAALTEWERAEIADRVAASVPIRAKLGKPLNGQTSLGYRWDGKTLVIDEQEAPIRKLIYETFLQTRRKKATAKILNEKGYRTRGGSKFTHGTITRLLRDTTAKGLRKANYTTGKKGDSAAARLKPESEWVITPCPAIIPVKLWDECNRILDEQLAQKTPPGPKAVHLLSGYLTCTCGKKLYVYHKDKSPTYRCKACNVKVEVSQIDGIYHRKLKTLLLTETDIADHLRQSDAELKEKEALLEAAKTEIVQLRKEMGPLIKMRAREEMSREAFIASFRPLEEQVEQLEEHLPELEAEIEFLKIRYLSTDTIFREARDLYHNWPDMPFERKRSIVESITNEIIVGKEDILISLSYLPAPLLNGGKSDRKERFTALA